MDQEIKRIEKENAKRVKESLQKGLKDTEAKGLRKTAISMLQKWFEAKVIHEITGMSLHKLNK